MRIGILGTGIVGQTIGTKFTSLGPEVKLGSRSAQNEKGAGWTLESPILNVVIARPA